jgi:hypothetical protein
MFGEAALPAVSALRDASRDPNEYVRRKVEEALQTLPAGVRNNIDTEKPSAPSR